VVPVIAVDAVASARIEAYLDEVERFNRRINLTTVPRDQAWDRHIVDSLTLLELAAPAIGERVVDVGSGAGIPGIPFALVRPDLELTLVEADRRRAGFLTHVAGLLSLSSVRVVSERAEAFGHSVEGRERFDVAVSRAAAPPRVLCELTLPLLRIGGRLLALVGSGSDLVAGSARAARLCGGGDPTSPAPGVLAVVKEQPTPPRLPRREGVPNRRPL
jgi:16S rRNA (guanine527-N7)-methyltransferase